MFTFVFADKFPTLIQSDFDNAYSIISVRYSGVNTLWDSDASKDAKRTLLNNYLVAWYLANTYPDKVRGIVADGGKPLTSKSVGGTSVSFKDIQVQPGLEHFTTNTFGIEAVRMMMSAPERFKLYG